MDYLEEDEKVPIRIVLGTKFNYDEMVEVRACDWSDYFNTIAAIDKLEKVAKEKEKDVEALHVVAHYERLYRMHSEEPLEIFE